MTIQLVRKILSGTAWIISVLVIVLATPEYSEYEVMIAWMAVVIIPIMEYLFWKGIIK